MKLSIAVLGWALAGTALADCKDDLGKVDKLIAKVEMEQAQQAQISQQREAALLLMNSGKDDLCQNVVNGMEDSLERQREANITASERNEKLREVKGATPIPAAQGVVRASKLIGLPVKNKNGDKLGTLEDVAIDASSGVVAYVALAHGGILGLGEKWIAVPWRQMSRTKDGNAIVVEIAEESLKKMTGFDEENWPQTYDAQSKSDAGAAGPARAPAK